MKKDLLRDKSFSFALRIVKLSQYLQKNHKEHILSKQILRSGTSIGALIREAQYAQSTADFLHKLTIALKEANETEYWLLILNESNYINEKMYNSIAPEIDELLKLLISSTKKIKESI
ncbi:four helix bundle protein [Sulfurovum riftiae]|uniref:Four helix bundle protein n=1 Tax=Sulfurovum riftiae TaxID=1630136 RepID=A0A151CEZ4_9BACT|nr:four helix bundle protein [Sulfurovum riftiae]KYJ86112.1 four helix bundle protein [Sulfurovum riftiae]